MNLGRQITELDIGKYFQVRDPEVTEIVKVRIDALVADRTVYNERVVATLFLLDGRRRGVTYDINGYSISPECETAYDLVAEYVPESDTARLQTENRQLCATNEYLKARVVALELALEFYADEANWRYRHEVAAYDDRGQRAREVLGMVKDE